MSDREGSIERNHFKIGEVAEMIGVRPHVLRYWEQEFPGIRPKKTRGAHRHYSRRDVALLRRIHELVVISGYSIAGARARLAEERQLSLPETADASRGPTLADELLSLREELAALLELIGPGESDDGRLAGAQTEAPAAVVVREVRSTTPRR